MTDLIKEAEAIKRNHNTIKEQTPIQGGALWTVNSEYVESLENIKQKLTQALKEKEAVLDSEELVEEVAAAICKSLGGDYNWIKKYEAQDGTSTDSSDWHKKHAQAAIKTIKEKLGAQ